MTSDARAVPAPFAAGGRRGHFGWLGDFSRRQPVGAAALSVLVVILVTALLSPWIAPYDPFENNLTEKWSSPSAEHLMGTDQYGRDTFSRILLGARYSLLLGFGATLIGTTLGAFLGLLSAYLRGKFDLLLLRLVDVKQAMPALVFTLLIIAAVGPSVLAVMVALSVGLIARPIRVIRSAALATRELMYVDAARAIGASGWRIILLHIAPACIAPYIVLLSISVGGVIVAEASLGFLGLGVQPPTPTWGQILNRAQQTFRQNPWLAIFPGIAISVTVFACNLLGDAVRDYLDPKLRGR